jgi:Xaa-Pro aminopeptidase
MVSQVVPSPSTNGAMLSDCLRARQHALRVRLAVRKLAALLVTKPISLFYLTGFRGTAGLAIFTASDSLLLVDPRYTLQARIQGVDVEVLEVKTSLLRAAHRRLSMLKRVMVGFEETHLTWAEFRILWGEAKSDARWQPAGRLIEELRAIKDRAEIACMRHAGKVTTQAFQEVAGKLQPGVPERDVAAEIEYRMRQHGADGAAFETIVASGPRAALPHARPSGKPLQTNEFVIFDLGATVSGYVSDMTRTLYLGNPDRRGRSLYQSVLDAQSRALESLRPGVRAGEVDATARRQLARHHLDTLFTHSTGHGVGLEIHERPRLAKREKKRISAGNVVTVEPGIYLEGLGGIRLEDTVLVGPQGLEILTPAPKDQWWLA